MFALNTRSTGTATFNGKGTMLFGYKGMNFSVSQLSALLGVCVGTIYSRLHKGYAVDAVCRRGRLSKVHTIDGREFTVKNIANAFGIPTYKVYNVLTKCSKKHLKVSLEMFVK